MDPSADVHFTSLIAGDFSANTTTFAFTNSGTITGDIIFGSGANTFTIDGEDDDEGENLATVTGEFAPVGDGTLDIALSETAPSPRRGSGRPI